MKTVTAAGIKYPVTRPCSDCDGQFFCENCDGYGENLRVMFECLEHGHRILILCKFHGFEEGK